MQKIKDFKDLTEQEYLDLMDELRAHRFLATFDSINENHKSFFVDRTPPVEDLYHCFVFGYSHHPRIRLGYDPSVNLEPFLFDLVLNAYKEQFGDKADYREL